MQHAHLTAATPATGDGAQTPLRTAEASFMLDAAREAWRATGALNAAQLAVLDAAQVTVADLSGDSLGTAAGTLITVDVNAAGHGWFVDVQPAASTAFAPDANGVLRATPGSGAEAAMDLYSVLLHELGHTLGFTHLPEPEPGHVMSDTLEPGTRASMPQSLIWDEATGSFVDPDTALTLKAHGPPAPPPKEIVQTRDEDETSTEDRIAWAGAAKSFLDRFAAFFG
jgi:hypothetical protein